MPEDDEILKNGTVDFVSISYYSSNCVSVTKKGKITAANGGENIKNPYLEASAWGWQIDVLLVQKSHCDKWNGSELIDKLCFHNTLLYF